MIGRFYGGIVRIKRANHNKTQPSINREDACNTMPYMPLFIKKVQPEF